MVIYITLRLDKIGEYNCELALERAIREQKRACVALYEHGSFSLYTYFADHHDDPHERRINYEYDTQLETDNLRLAIYTLYRPNTAILIERNQPVSIINYEIG